MSDHSDHQSENGDTSSRSNTAQFSYPRLQKTGVQRTESFAPCQTASQTSGSNRIASQARTTAASASQHTGAQSGFNFQQQPYSGPNISASPSERRYGSTRGQAAPHDPSSDDEHDDRYRPGRRSSSRTREKEEEERLLAQQLLGIREDQQSSSKRLEKMYLSPLNTNDASGSSAGQSPSSGPSASSSPEETRGRRPKWFKKPILSRPGSKSGF